MDLRTQKNATTMSVAEMQKMLGLKKTDAYWMTHQNYFKVIQVNGKMRIDIASFEDWYAHQRKRRKVSGPEPGAALREESYSVQEVANMLGVETDAIYALIQKGILHAEKIDFHMRIRKDEFEAWYASQDHYRNQEDRDRDRELEENSMSVPEMGRLLGIDDRREAYKLANKLKGSLKYVVIADHRRVTKESFEEWYSGQNEYHKRTVNHRKKTTSNTSKMDIDPDKVLYTAEETAVLLDLSLIHIRCLIKAGKLKARKLGNQWRVHRDDILRWIHQQENNGEETV